MQLLWQLLVYFLLKEYAPGWTPQGVQFQTGAKLIVAADVKEVEF